MNLNQALMVVRNPTCYDRETVVNAAKTVLASLDASEEDVLAAASLI